jgi:hypothetical protein
VGDDPQRQPPRAGLADPVKLEERRSPDQPVAVEADQQRHIAFKRHQAGGFGGADSGCAGLVHSGSGGGNAYKTNVLVNDNGSRVAVLLLNGRTVKSNGDPTAAAATLRLYCAAS